MAQPQNATPDQWVRRKSDSAITDLSRELRAELAAVRGEVHGIWPKLIAILGTTAVVVISAAWLLVSGASRQSADDVRQVRTDVGAQVMQVRTETAERLNRFEAKQDAILGVIVDGIPRAEAKRDLARRTKE